MEIGILQNDDDEPVSLKRKRENGVKSQHTEFLVYYELIKVSKIHYGSDTTVFFGDCEVAREKALADVRGWYSGYSPLESRDEISRCKGMEN